MVTAKFLSLYFCPCSSCLGVGETQKSQGEKSGLLCGCATGIPLKLRRVHCIAAHGFATKTSVSSRSTGLSPPHFPQVAFYKAVFA